MQEADIGGVEEGDAEGKPGAHDEVLDVVGKNDGHGAADGVSDLGEDPVKVEAGDGGEGQRQAAQPEGWPGAVRPAKGHTGENEDCPGGTEGHVEDAHGVPPRRCRGQVVDGETCQRCRVHCNGRAAVRFWGLNGRMKASVSSHRTGERQRFLFQDNLHPRCGVSKDIALGKEGRDPDRAPRSVLEGENNEKVAGQMVVVLADEDDMSIDVPTIRWTHSDDGGLGGR